MTRVTCHILGQRPDNGPHHSAPPRRSPPADRLRPSRSPATVAHSQADFEQRRRLISGKCATDGIRPADDACRRRRRRRRRLAPASHQFRAAVILVPRRAANAAATAPRLPPPLSGDGV